MAKEMLINVSEGEECRIALLNDDGKLDELYMERTSSTSHVGNIYKGRVTNVEASIQAAFVDFGLGRNGFLHISDLMPTYFGRKGEDIQESVGRKMARRDRPPIQRCLRRGDEIIVQIIKEGIGTKGPTLSTYLSIPGRILVMMPGMGKMGVSKKIEDEEERRKLRTILDSLKPPKGVGFIIRTAGIGKTKTEIQRDLTYLSRLWQTIEKKRTSGPGPTELYTEGDLVTRTVRDVFSSDVDKIIVDSKDVAKRVKDVIKITAPRTKNKVIVYEQPIPLFHKYNIETDIEQMYSRHVPLPSGGSLVIDSTEAIVAIDVNSGKFRDHSDAEMTAFRTDMEAADEIPRQLKLRDLGGVIICDFIDLRYERHRRELEERLHENFKKDRAKTKVLRMSQFGIIEITRQRMRPSLKRSIYFDCPHCKGAGLVKTPESMSLDVMRRLAIGAHNEKVARIELSVCPDVSFYLLNKKRNSLSKLEAATKKKIVVRNDPTLGLDEMKLDLFDARDGLIIIEELGLATSQPPHTTQLGTRPHGAGRGGRGGRDRGGRGGRHQQARGGGGRGGDRNQQDAGSSQQSRGEGAGGGGGGEHDDRFELEETEEAAEERDERRGEPADPALVAKIAPTIVRDAPTKGGDRDADDEEEHDIDEAGEAEAEGEGEAESDVIDVEDGHSSLGDRPAGEWEPHGGGGGGGQGHRRRRRGRRGGRGGDRAGGGGGGGGGDRDRGGNQQQQPRQQQQQPRHPQQQQRPPQQRPPQQQQPPKPAVAIGAHGDEEVDVPGPGNEKMPGSGDQGGPGFEQGEEGQRRRRRRRGGRRHRRRREREREEALKAQGQGPGQGGAPIAGLPQDDDEDDEDRSSSPAAVADDREAEPMRGEEPPEDEAPGPGNEAPAPDEAEEEAEAKPAPKKKRPSRRGGRGGGGGKSGGSASRKAPAKAPTRTPPKTSSTTASAASSDNVPIVKTGSTDKHLVNDEPVEPQPVRRPRGREDLDAIPDDYD